MSIFPQYSINQSPWNTQDTKANFEIGHEGVALDHSETFVCLWKIKQKTKHINLKQNPKIKYWFHKNNLLCSIHNSEDIWRYFSNNFTFEYHLRREIKTFFNLLLIIESTEDQVIAIENWRKNDSRNMLEDRRKKSN